MTKEHYWLYDRLWENRMQITQALKDHGEETVRDINQLMPNFLTYDRTAQPPDEVASDFGFESLNDLVEYLLAYRPRTPLCEQYYEHILAERTGEDGTADIPF